METRVTKYETLEVNFIKHYLVPPTAVQMYMVNQNEREGGAFCKFQNP